VLGLFVSDFGDFQAIQIWLGMSKLFGMDLLRNFNYPYFERYCRVLASLAHSSWFLDYLYIGGSKGSKMKQVRNVYIIL
jgi:D-alanyl-lipoteichoic acid acyltransferase DltB (MBOAT superfamily)